MTIEKEIVLKQIDAILDDYSQGRYGEAEHDFTEIFISDSDYQWISTRIRAMIARFAPKRSNIR